MPPGRWR